MTDRAVADGIDTACPAPIIKTVGLAYTYRGASDPALADVHLTVAPGEFAVITGRSGCGKSTLGLALGGYLFQQYDGTAQGTLTVGGIDARRAPIYEVADVVGLVQQNPEAQFCTLTVQDEVAFGLENRCLPPDEIRERLTWALDVVGAAHLVDRELRTLSGGEKQKVAIASVMALRPRVLILDEPTSNLDPRATAEIFSVIDAIRATAGMTVLVIEHKLDYLRHFDPRVIRMEAGRVAQDAPLSELAPGARLCSSPPTHRLDAAPVAVVRDLAIALPDRDGTPAARLLLDGVTFSVQPGERVAVMGNNGSGKTTLLRALLGLRQPSRGTVQVLGQATHATPVSQIAREVGFAFQNPDHQLFCETVWEEATAAPRNFGVLDAATQATLTQMLNDAGLGTRLTDHPYRLSYGEKRRLTLIAVLAYRPRLLLLDEILIGQDEANIAYLLGLVADAARAGTAVVMVNHNPHVTQQWAERLLFLEEGRLIVDAPVDDAFDQLAAQGYEAYVPRSCRPQIGTHPAGGVNRVPEVA